MARDESLKVKADEFFSSIPDDMKADVERMYQAFKARMMYETHVQGRWHPEGQISGRVTERLISPASLLGPNQ